MVGKLIVKFFLKMNKKLTAFVALKEHSERIKNKNIKEFGGQPLFFQILRTLENVQLISEIVVDTDSEIISELTSKNFNSVKVFKRPEKLRGDFISMDSIIEHYLPIIDTSYIVQTHATNPLLTSNTLNKAISLYYKNLGTFDSIFSVNRLNKRLYDSSGKLLVSSNCVRTQDIPAIYERNANFYIFSKKSFKESSSRIGMNPYMFEMNKLESIDIDEPEDFLIAELVYKHNKSQNE